jgi:hypothetical protein
MLAHLRCSALISRQANALKAPGPAPSHDERDLATTQRKARHDQQTNAWPSSELQQSLHNLFVPHVAAYPAGRVPSDQNRIIFGVGRIIMGRSLEGHFFFLGTLLPFLRALESAMAIACLRLFTLPPFPPWPLFAVPLL